MGDDEFTISNAVATPESVSLLLDRDLTTPTWVATLEDAARYTLFDGQTHKVNIRQVTYLADVRTVVIKPEKPITGDALYLRVNLNLALQMDPVDVRHVPLQESPLRREAGVATRAVEDAFSYALLTEQVGGGGSPYPQPAGGGGGGANLGQLVTRTLSDVLGWKVRASDAKAFSGALEASFVAEDVDGETAWAWRPRTYAVQTDMGGGITGAQASLYKRAQEALTQSLPLLDGLSSRDPEADTENIDALKAVCRAQLSQLVNELATPGGPGKTRVDQFFHLLLADHGRQFEQGGRLHVVEPDQIGGTLGRLRDLLGLSRIRNFVNTIDDEQNLTNFRILADYTTSLAQSWLNNRDLFGLDAKRPFLGTQLVPLSRQLSVIGESVDEVRFALDSVFIGVSERQTLRIEFGDQGMPLYVEDFLQWIQNFVTTEAPVYVREGGKFGVTNSVLPFAVKLQHMVGALLDHQLNRGLPHGFGTARVQRALQSLHQELDGLARLAGQLRHDFVIEPPPSALRALVEAPRLLVVPASLSFKEKGSHHKVQLFNLSAGTLHVSGSLSAANFEFLVGSQGQPRVTQDIPGGGSLSVTLRALGERKAARADFQYTTDDANFPPGTQSVELSFESTSTSK